MHIGNPEISVVMYVYNHGQYVKESVQSVLSQSFIDYELIILNNGSSDETAEILKEFNDARIRLLFEPVNVTAYWGVEECCNVARGRYIAFIGSDDIWLPTKLEKQYNVLEANPKYGAVFSEVALIDRYGQSMNWTPFYPAERNMPRFAWLRHFFFFSNCLCWSSALLRRELKPASSHADARFRQLGDLFLWIKILKHRDLYIYPEVLTFYRQHGENESQKDTKVLHNRSYLEMAYILEIYKTLSLDELRQVFPELRENDVVNERTKDYFIARLALNEFQNEGCANSRRLFGVATLFAIYNDQELVRELAGNCGFDLNAFYCITGTGIDITYDDGANRSFVSALLQYERNLIDSSYAAAASSSVAAELENPTLQTDSAPPESLPTAPPDKKSRHLLRDLSRAIRQELRLHKASRLARRISN